MLNKLRFRFILLNMALALLVLVVSFVAVCYIDYQQRVQDVYEALSATLDQAQSPTVSQIEKLLPLIAGSGESSAAQQAEAHTVEELAAEKKSETSRNSGNMEIGGRGQSKETLIPVAVYLAKADGTYTALGDFASASISHTVLLAANAEVLASPTSSGLLDDQGLYFEKRNTSNGTMIAYADVSTASGWQQLALTLVGVGLLTLGAFLLINIFFSWWALKPTERAWQQQTQFVADASHELKTPLTVILANMSIVRSHPDDTVSSQSQWIESTQTEAERMQDLVNDMLDLARPEDAARAEMHMEDVDLSDLAEGEVLQFESVAFELGVEMKSSIVADVHVEGAKARLQRMVSTLIDNACKYVEDGGNVNVELVVRERSAGRNEALFSVHNSGSVIPEEDLPHVFDRFYRADKARTSGKGGYGLGLAIAQEIAHEHGGEITVTSTPDEGTTFTAKLPIVG